MSVSLDGRLACAAKFVRQGARFADIGTDHAYLPIFLLKAGIIDYAVCSDINEGPLQSAVNHAKESGVYEKIDFCLSNGADALTDKEITDVAVCGMGGELIGSIISHAPHLKREGIRLILQPMTKAAPLRILLAREGFSIETEDYSSSNGKYYLTLVASYTQKAREISEFEAEFGNESILIPHIKNKEPYLIKKRASLKKIADGKKKGGEPDSPEARLFSYIDNLICKFGG